MMKRILGALAALLIATAPVLAGGSVIAPPSAGGGAPTGTAGGDLGGSYPNPLVAAVNGNSVPAGALADQILLGTASNTLGWKSLPDCALPQALNYAVATHTWSCGTPPGTAAGAVVPYTTQLWYRFEGSFPNSSSTFASARIFCSPGTVRASIKPTTVGNKITTVGTGNTGNMKWGIYADTLSATGRTGLHSPGALLAATGDISTANFTNATTPSAGTGTLTTPLASPLVPGTLYWKCGEADGTSAAMLSASTAFASTTIGDSNLVNAPASTSSGLTEVATTNTVTYSAAMPSDMSTVTGGLGSVNISTPDLFFQAP